MLNVLEKEINNLNLFQGNIPKLLYAIADSIPSKSIPYRMKLALAVSELMLYTSQFHISIKHWNGSLIPINSILFCIAKSGAAKDSSLRAVRKCFNVGYDIINKARNEKAVNRAIKAAEADGCDLPEKFAVYKAYYTAPNPLFVAISTPEGFLQHLNRLDEDGIGAGFCVSGEIGQDLSSNVCLPELMKTIAELYDTGDKEVKVLKDKEKQSKEIKNMPVSAVFLGSQDNILYDEVVKGKFKEEFSSKLARRSFLVYADKDIAVDNYISIKDMIEVERQDEDKAIAIRNEVSQYIEEITPELLNAPFTSLSISEEVRDLLILYKQYGEALSATIDTQHTMAKLTRAHLYWKCLKLAGALALSECSDTILLEHYRAAIEFCELINDDIGIFEKDLTKEPYELFVHYCHTYSSNGTYSISLHNLRKLGFLHLKGQSTTALKELVKLANSYDELGVYSLKNDTVVYTELKVTDHINLSYLACTGTKQQRAVKCNTGFQCEELAFTDLAEMLKDDYAYSPFKFNNGIRGKDNILGGCKWIVLDVDSSEITDTEAHLLLSDINHYVVRTSNKDNPNKYRILIELDIEVDIPDIRWKTFITSIANDLGFTVDGLPKSQIFFSYKDRDILSTLDAVPLTTKPYLDVISNIQLVTKKPPSKTVCSAMLSNPIDTFEKAFDAKDGEGRRRLIWAVKYAKELGADEEYCHNLLDQISDYWCKPLPSNDLEAMHRQISRWSWS